MERLPKFLIEMEREILGEIEPYERPKTRGDCFRVPRPCPFVGCKYNLYLDIDPRTQSIRYNFPDLEPDQMLQSCVLDIAYYGPRQLEQVGLYLNLSRERIRQIEFRAIHRMLIGLTPTGTTHGDARGTL